MLHRARSGNRARPARRIAAISMRDQRDRPRDDRASAAIASRQRRSPGETGAGSARRFPFTKKEEPVLAGFERADRAVGGDAQLRRDRPRTTRPHGSGSVFGRDVRRCRPTARFVRFLQPEAATRAGGLTAERLAATRGTEALRSRLRDLVPTHDWGPRPLRRRSTWLLLSPNTRSQARCRGAIAPSRIQSSRHRRRDDRSRRRAVVRRRRSA